MRKPTLFISSTCKDLAQIRADLRDIIQSLGYEVILSEYNFPTDPQLSTIDNCISVVLERADILILLIGERYGYIPNGDKSVTHLEYIYARAKGIPVYVFVKNETLSYSKLWKQDPDNQIFEHVVDTNKLFSFLNEIMSGGIWVHGFNGSAEISKELKEQLAVLFFKGLELNFKMTRHSVKSQHFAGIPLRIVIEKPRAWEFKLFAEVLDIELSKLDNIKRSYKLGLAFGRMLIIDTPTEVFDWTIAKNSELTRYVDVLTRLVREVFPEAFGSTGYEGNDKYINYTALMFVEVYKGLLLWYLEHKMIIVPDELVDLVEFNAHLNYSLVEDLEEFFTKIIAEKDRIDQLPSGSQVGFTLTLRPPDIEGFFDKMNSYREHLGLEPIIK